MGDISQQHITSIKIKGKIMSRKITELACRAFHRNENFKRDNTEVCVDKDNNGEVLCTKMFLFGNLIAIKYAENNIIKVCFQGWNSNTTRERLNGLSNVSFTTKRGKLYMDENEIDSYKWYII